MQTHDLKVWQEYFGLLVSGIKNYELRKNDRNFKSGDYLVLREFDKDANQYTGNFVHRRIYHVLEGGIFGLEEGFCILSI